MKHVGEPEATRVALDLHRENPYQRATIG